jgi:hypothetical protein
MVLAAGSSWDTSEPTEAREMDEGGGSEGADADAVRKNVLRWEAVRCLGPPPVPTYGPTITAAHHRELGDVMIVFGGVRHGGYQVRSASWSGRCQWLQQTLSLSLSLSLSRTHTHTHARTRTHAHARTHARTHARRTSLPLAIPARQFGRERPASPRPADAGPPAPVSAPECVAAPRPAGSSERPPDPGSALRRGRGRGEWAWARLRWRTPRWKLLAMGGPGAGAMPSAPPQARSVAACSERLGGVDPANKRGAPGRGSGAWDAASLPHGHVDAGEARPGAARAPAVRAVPARTTE